jgi:hypothetical protein
MSMTVSAKELDKEFGKEKLCEFYLTENCIVYTILRSVSTSGMCRHISLVIPDKDGTIKDITYYAAAALGESLYEKNGHRSIRQNGCGMDMGFNLVYNLAYVLYGNGYSLTQRWL